MKLILNINYRTNWGERLFVEYHDESGTAGPTQRRLMTQGNADGWTAEIEMRPSQPEFVYRYLVIRDDGSERHEWGAARRHRSNCLTAGTTSPPKSPSSPRRSLTASAATLPPLRCLRWLPPH